MKLRKYIGLMLLVLIGTYIWFLSPYGIPTGSGLEKNHWLSFWGGFLSFAGTITLGTVAWKQNEKANQTAEKAHELSKKMLDVELEKSYPYVVVKESASYAKEQTSINPEVIKKEPYCVGTRTPIGGDGKYFRINEIMLFYYDAEQEIDTLKEFVLSIVLENFSETVIQSIKIEKVITNLFLKKTDLSSTRTEYDIKDSFQLNASHALMPHDNILLEFRIASNYEFLNDVIFQGSAEIIV